MKENLPKTNFLYFKGIKQVKSTLYSTLTYSGGPYFVISDQKIEQNKGKLYKIRVHKRTLINQFTNSLSGQLLNKLPNSLSGQLLNRWQKST